MEWINLGAAWAARPGKAFSLALLLAACGTDSSETIEPQQPVLFGDASVTQGTPSPTLPTTNGQTPMGTVGQGAGPAQGTQGGASSGTGSTGGAGDAGVDAPDRKDGGTSASGTGAAAGGDAATGDSGMVSITQPGSVDLPVCPSTAPAEFQPNPNVGGGGSQYKDSPHFRIHGASDAQADAALKELEAAYSCFVETLCWRSSGLSIKAGDSGPYYKMNFYVVGSLGSAAGQMFSDPATGLAYEKVVTSYLIDPKVTVHEYGHALTYHEKGWVDQTRTGAWWESVANFVADTYMTSPLCEKARARFGQAEGKTLIDLNKVIGSSFQVIVDGSSGTGNYYQAWPFLTYLTNNPDGFAGLGATALRDMFRKHMRNNETPLHVLERIAAPTSVQKIVGRYWARMAYLDIGHKQAQAAFMSGRSKLTFANLDATGEGGYRVKSARQPRYFGANIIPLKATGKVTVQVTSEAPFTATLAIRASSGSVRYVDLEKGAGEATVEAGEEASLVVVNTPATLYQYDPFSITGDVARGLDYQVKLTGATAAN